MPAGRQQQMKRFRLDAVIGFVLIKKEIPATASSFVIHRNSFEVDFDLGDLDGVRQKKNASCSFVLRKTLKEQL